MSDVTRQMEDLIKNWQHSEREVKRAKSELNRSECDLRNNATALAKFLAPNDAKMDETFSVWFGDSLIQVRVTSVHPLDGVISIRLRGKALSI